MLTKLVFGMLVIFSQSREILSVGDECNESSCYCQDEPKYYTESKLEKSFYYPYRKKDYEWVTKKYSRTRENNCKRGQYCYMIGYYFKYKTCMYKSITKDEICNHYKCGCGTSSSGYVPAYCYQGNKCNKIKEDWLCGNDFIKVDQKCIQKEGCTCIDAPLSEKKYLSALINENEICGKADGELSGYQKTIKPEDTCDEANCLCEAKDGNDKLSKFIKRNQICKQVLKKLFAAYSQIDPWTMCEKGPCFCKSPSLGENPFCLSQEWCVLKDGKSACMAKKIGFDQKCDFWKRDECFCEAEPTKGKIERVFVKKGLYCVRVDKKIQLVDDNIADGGTCNYEVCSCTNMQEDNTRHDEAVTILCKKNDVCGVVDNKPSCLKKEDSIDKVCTKAEGCACLYGSKSITCKKDETCKGGREHGCYKSIIESGATCEEETGCFCYDNPKNIDGSLKNSYNSGVKCAKGLFCLPNIAKLSMTCIKPEDVMEPGKSLDSYLFGCKVTHSETKKVNYRACSSKDTCLAFEDRPVCAKYKLKNLEVCVIGKSQNESRENFCICGDLSVPDGFAVCKYRDQCVLSPGKKPECKRNVIQKNAQCDKLEGCSCIAKRFWELDIVNLAAYEAVTCQNGHYCLEAPNGYDCSSLMSLSSSKTSDSPAGFACKFQITDYYSETIMCHQYQTCIYERKIGVFCQETSKPFIIQEGERCSNKRAGCQCTLDNKKFEFCKAAEVCKKGLLGGPSCKEVELDHFICPMFHHCLCGKIAKRNINKEQFCELGVWNSYREKKPSSDAKYYSDAKIREDILRRMKAGKHILYQHKRNLAFDPEIDMSNVPTARLDVLVKI